MHVQELPFCGCDRILFWRRGRLGWCFADRGGAVPRRSQAEFALVDTGACDLWLELALEAGIEMDRRNLAVHNHFERAHRERCVVLRIAQRLAVLADLEAFHTF